MTRLWTTSQTVWSYKIKHREGHLKFLELTTMPIIVDGETQGVFGIAKDITHQH